MVAHNFSSSIQGIEAGKSLWFKVSLAYIVSSKPAKAA